MILGYQNQPLKEDNIDREKIISLTQIHISNTSLLIYLKNKVIPVSMMLLTSVLYITEIDRAPDSDVTDRY